MRSDSPPAGSAKSNRLAVLPLVNIGGSSQDEYFVDGLTEELISTLSRIAGLSVIARTSAMQYKGTNKALSRVASELGVQNLVEGSVRRSGRKVRIAVRLIKATTQEELWSADYDREVEDVLAIQREIARRVGRALKVTLGKGDERGLESGSTVESNAYDLYLRGRFQWNLRSEAGLKRGVEFFEQAIEKDRTFALAFCGLADAWAQLGWLEFTPPTEAFPRAREAAERALAIDDHLAEAHASLGFVRFLYERDWKPAEEELTRAIFLNPGYPVGHQFYADFLKAMGRFAEALTEMRKALELDPVSMAVNTGFGHVLYLSRDFDGAIEQYRRALELDPTFGPAHLWFGRPFLQKGMFKEAIAEIQQAVASSGGSTISLAVLAHAYASAGNEPEARRILDDLLQRSQGRYLPSYWIALVYTGLGDADQALTWLEKAYEERSSWLVWINVEPRFDTLRPERRFASLLRRMRLEGSEPAVSNAAPVNRRLAAIMFTDLVGFTKLGQRDEEEALRIRKEHQALVRPLLAPHGGREVKTLGDGFLIEFPSAVESVRCAVEIQEAVARRNNAPDVKERIVLRIGIHVGDVVGDGGDIVGDAVNVASRIEPLAEPGGICVSGSVFDQVRNKLRLPIEKVGSRALKNVEYPVDIYRIVLWADAVRPRPPTEQVDSNLRLAVLPFANLSPDAGDDYFADGLTDELITRSSKIPSLRVIARTSILRYKGSSKSLREVGQDLGVRMALEGSVRKAGNRVRITVQLVDTNSEEPLWSSRFERPLDDIFAIQDEIAGHIANQVSIHLSGGVRKPPTVIVHEAPDTQDLEAYASFLHGRKLFAEKTSEETIRKALGFFEEAVRRDPKFARARVGIAECVLYLGGEGALPYSDAQKRGLEEVTNALQLNEALADAHTCLASILLTTEDFAGSQKEARRAMELNPSLADPYRWLAQIAAGRGAIDESLTLLETAHQIDPLDINIMAFLGRSYFYSGRESKALEFWERTKPLVAFRTNAHMTEYYLAHQNYSKADETIREMERIRPTSVWTEMYRGFLAARRGDKEAARREIETLEGRTDVIQVTIFLAGFVHFALGETDAFFAAMYRAREDGAEPVLELRYSPLFASIRGDPRFVELQRKWDEIPPAVG
ncbi:MAG: tetratricopeptide repeat protein [Thermoplasmata archaeon]|jgi:adenylate cyclase